MVPKHNQDQSSKVWEQVVVCWPNCCVRSLSLTATCIVQATQLQLQAAPTQPQGLVNLAPAWKRKGRQVKLTIVQLDDLLQSFQ